MPYTDLEFFSMIATHYTVIRSAAVTYRNSLVNLSDASILTRTNLATLVNNMTAYMSSRDFAYLRETDLTQDIRFKVMNKVLEYYRGIYVELDSVNWQGNFVYADMRNAFIDAINPAFLIDDAVNRLNTMREEYQQRVNDYIENEDVDVEEDEYEGFDRIEAAGDRLVTIHENSTDNNIVRTNEQVIQLITSLDAFLTVDISNLGMNFDIDLPFFYIMDSFVDEDD